MRLKKFWIKYKLYITGFWGIVTTFLSLYWSVFPFDQNPELSYYKKSSVDVFNVDHWSREIHIEFNGKDVKASDLNLKIVKLNVVNDGRKDIMPAYYASNPAFGLKVREGKILLVDVVKPGSSINQRNFIQNFNADSSFVFFQHLFWPRDEQITLNVWIAHKKNQAPQLIPSGRIADTPITMTDDPEKKLTRWEEMKQVFIILFKYLISWFVPLTFFMLLFEYLQKKNRKKRLRKAYGINYDPSNKSQRVLIEYASPIKQVAFIDVMRQMQDKETRNRIYRDCRSVLQQIEHFEELTEESPYLGHTNGTSSIRFQSNFWSLVLLLRETRLIDESEDEQPVFHPEFEEAVDLTIRVLV